VSLIRKKKPPHAIIEKIIDIFTKATLDKVSGATIGKQLDVIVIPRDPNSPVRTEYRSSVIKRETYVPDQVYVTGKDKHLTISNIRIEPVDPATPPMSGPKLRPNQPCWCKSGKKYKNCHDSKKKSEIKFLVSPRTGTDQ
jgi:SEC-C motif-containing protein